MKKLLLGMLLASGLSYGQFTVSAGTSDWKPVGEFHKMIETTRKDNQIMLSYDDRREHVATVNSDLYGGLGKNIGNLAKKYGKYQFVFSIEPDTLNKLYAIIEEHFNEKKAETLTLTFPEGNLYLKFVKIWGAYYLNLGTDQGGTTIYSVDLNAKSAAKLFGLDK